jgi:hypothetical protein
MLQGPQEERLSGPSLFTARRRGSTGSLLVPGLCKALEISLPPRSPRISQPMLVTFDISCGDDLLPGHTFVARGLADEGRSRDDLRGAQTLHDECQMVDLVYELVPGVEAAEAPTDKSRPFTVDATFGADVPLSWSTGGTGPDGSGGPCWIEIYRWGASTVGGLGPWPVPDGAQHLTFWLHAADDYKCRGALRVDLSSHAVRWDPIETIS